MTWTETPLTMPVHIDSLVVDYLVFFLKIPRCHILP